MECFTIKSTVTETPRQYWIYDYPIEKPKCKSVTSIQINSRKGSGSVYLELFTYNEGREIDDMIYSGRFLFGDNEHHFNVFLKLPKDKNIGFSGRVSSSIIESPLVLVQINFDEYQGGNAIIPTPNNLIEKLV